MRLTKKLRTLKEKLEACPEVSKAEFKPLKSHIRNNIEVTITLNTTKRPNLDKVLSQYKWEYEGISELNLLKVGKHKVVIKIV